ncbi:MAG: porin, partial [Polymorphobacter sp.]
MKLNKMTAVLLAATMLGGVASPALAATKRSGDSDLRAIVERQQKQIDELNAQIQAMRANAVPVVGALADGVVADAAAADENAANIEFMAVTVEAQQAQIDALKKSAAANAPNWKGAPEFKSSAGFSWKPNGVIQYDGGYVSNPNNLINTANLGWNSNFRRLLFGVEGTVPGDFKYKFQFDVAGGALGFEDVLIAYEPAGKPYSFQAGYFYPFTSLDNMTSNRFLSVMERSQLNDAFGSGRRIGIAGAYATGEFLLQAGLMNGTTVNAATGNTAWSFDARAVWFPKFGTAQYHAAIGYHNR